jgi:hypothetical protein
LHHADKSAVGCLANPKNDDQRELFELTQLWQHHPESLTNFAMVANRLPLQHTNMPDFTKATLRTDEFVAESERVYENFLIDVVAETFTSGDCLFITEKTVRPMLLKKPMIAMGPCNYLDYLHQMGFKTFNDFWDENYDGFANGNRYVKILELIDQIAKLSVAELDHMYHDMQSILDHNYDLLINRSFNTEITYIS